MVIGSPKTVITKPLFSAKREIIGDITCLSVVNMYLHLILQAIYSQMNDLAGKSHRLLFCTIYNVYFSALIIFLNLIMQAFSYCLYIVILYAL